MDKDLAAMPSVLILFDIDGTLSDTGGAGGRAVAAAFLDVFGKEIDLGRIDFRGRTDYSLWREMMEMHGMIYAPDDPRLLEFERRYIDHLERMLRTSGPRALDGVHKILERLSREPAVALALLTGNIESGGRTKLRAVDLDQFFPVGGFGEDGESRTDVARAAIRRAVAHYGTVFPVERIFVVGDASADVQAARAVGARCIAVASGWTSEKDLAAENPDFIFKDLEDEVSLLKVLGL